MFPKAKRLTRKEFPTARMGGRRVSTQHLRLISGSLEPGYAVVVPKEAARLSVTRHKVKRRIFAILRAETALPKGLVVLAKAGVIALSPTELRAEIAEGLAKLA